MRRVKTRPTEFLVRRVLTHRTAVTDNPRVIAALRGELAVTELDESEGELFYDLVGLVGPSEAARAYFAAMRERGGGVGYDDEGRLVWGLPGGGVDVVRDADGKPVGTAHYPHSPLPLTTSPPFGGLVAVSSRMKLNLESFGLFAGS